jgi:ParB family chromosome partitioning protein
LSTQGHKPSRPEPVSWSRNDAARQSGSSFLKQPGFWFVAASAWAALTVASLLATLAPPIAELQGTRLFLLAALAGAAAAGCAFVAAAVQMRDFIAAGRSAQRERFETPMDLERLSEAQLVELDAGLEGLSRALAVDHPTRIATGLKLASRAVDQQTEAMKQELHRAADKTATAIEAHALAFSGRLAEEQSQLTQALDLYGETIAGRLKLASVALAREFRDNADLLQQRMQSTGEATVSGLARQGETLAKTLAEAVEQVERRMSKLSSGALTRLEDASAAAAEALEARSGAALERFAASAHALGAELDSSLSAHVERAETCQRGLLAAVDESGGAMTEWVSQAAKSVETALTRGVAGIDERVEAALARIETRLDGRVGELESRLRAVEGEMEDHAGERRAAASADFAAATRALHASMAAATAEFSEAVARQALEIEAIFARGSRASTQGWIAQAQSAAGALESASLRAADAVSGVEATVRDGLAALETGAGARAEDLAARLAERAEAVEAAAESVGARAARRADDLIETLGAAGQAFDRAAAAQAGALETRWNAWRAAWEEARETQAA